MRHWQSKADACRTYCIHSAPAADITNSPPCHHVILPYTCCSLPLLQAERRERLQKIVALRTEPLPEQPIIGQLVVEQLEAATELFYTEGPEGLKAARQKIAAWSLRRSKQR
jgi:hypothetical protein